MTAGYREESSTAAKTPSPTKRVPTQAEKERFGQVFALLLVFALFSLLAKNFFTIRNALTLVLQTSAFTLVGIGATFVLITGSVDFSIGAIVALAGTVSAGAASAGVPIWLSMLVGLGAGTFCGLINGVLITTLRLPPFITTLGTAMVIRGAVGGLTNALSKPAPEAFGDLGNGTLFKIGRVFPGVPYPVLIMALAAIAFGFLLGRTRIGRYFALVGSNEVAARYSGIRVARVKILTYMISGFCAALAGIIIASRLIASQPGAGTGYEVIAMSCAVMGGVSLSGGIGTVGGVAMGSLIGGVISAGLTMCGASYFFRLFVIGLLMLGPIALDRAGHKEDQGRKKA
jgi:ribose transport system permease protein